MFKFCPKCAGDLNKKTDSLLICQKCGFNFYQSPKPTNAAILENSQGQILLVKRKIEPQKGMLDLPGGFVEPGETVEESIKRELKEEIGVEVGDLEYFGSFTGDDYKYQGVLYCTLDTVFRGKIEEEVKAGSDAEEIIFFNKDEIKLEQLAFKDIRNAIEAYLKSTT